VPNALLGTLAADKLQKTAVRMACGRVNAGSGRDAAPTIGAPPSGINPNRSGAPRNSNIPTGSIVPPAIAPRAT
jgi:hypothetical protein